MAKGDEITFIPATDGDWETIREETLRALRKGHAAQVPPLFLYPPKFTVHIRCTWLDQLHQECILCLPET